KAKKRASDQGKIFHHPNKLVTPFALPERSMVASIAKAVIREGKIIINVWMTCKNFNSTDSPGSRIWWWNPPGTLATTRMTTATRASESLNTFPPMIFGIETYQAEIDVSIQMLTSVWPNAQNKVRPIIGSMVGTHPNAQGMTIPTTNTAIKREAKTHRTKTAFEKKANSGVSTPGFRFLQLW